MDLLSGSDSDSTEKKDNGFKINKSYAKTYDRFRKREEKQRLIDKYGDPNDSESEEEEIRTTPALDKEWLRAFAVVRFNQPRLYSGEKLFNEEVKPVQSKSEEKKFTLKDQERSFLLEKGGVVNDEDDRKKQRAGPSYFEEQEEIKKSLKSAIGKFDDDDDNDDSLFVAKEKSRQEERQEENDYLAWLKGEKNDLEDKEASKELAPLKAYWSNPNLSRKEQVLRDYILNNGYMDQEGKDGGSSDEDEDVDLSEDEEFLDKADSYERTYNFRHEEPGGCEIKSYPRVIETSVRAKEESRRAERRKRLAEKKQMEKEERMEELKMLQKIQREEKEEKIRKLEELSENPDIIKYLETDFDPEEHDKLMKKHYDDDYYQNEGEEDEKPVFEEDEDMGVGTYQDDTDDWWNQREQAQGEDVEVAIEEGGEELYADDPGFVMDADYDPEAEVSKKSKKEKKKGKKNKKDDKPLYDPTTKSFDEYLDEYLKDKINRLPFTYREVVPNDFGLSTEEILSAPDKELNSWVSVKRMSQYRTKDSELYDLKKYERKSKNQYKKYQAIPSLASKQRVIEPSDIKRPKVPKKKKKDKQDVHENDKVKDTKGDSNKLSEGKKKKQKKKGKLDNGSVKMETDNSTCDTGEVNEVKKKKKKEKQGVVSEVEADNSICDADESSELTKKKKKKKEKQMDNKEGIVKREQQDSSYDGGVSPKKKDKVIKDEALNSSQIIKTKKKKRKHDELNDSATNVSYEGASKKKIKLEESQSPQKKKLKKMNKQGKDHQYDGNTPVEYKNKKYRKNFSDLRVDVSDSTDFRPSGADKREVNRNLRMVMSKSRLDSYGLKKGGKKKKKDNEQTQD